MVFDLGLGSNLGDRLAALQGAVDGLRAAGCDVLALSGVYETEPVGGPEQGAFLNAVIRVRTDREPMQMLELVRALEHAARRVRNQRWGPRTLDVDILRAGDIRVREPSLEIPHPRMPERGFVLVPLHDIDPSIELGDVDTAGVEQTSHLLH